MRSKPPLLTQETSRYHAKQKRNPSRDLHFMKTFMWYGRVKRETVHLHVQERNWGAMNQEKRKQGLPTMLIQGFRGAWRSFLSGNVNHSPTPENFLQFTSWFPPVPLKPSFLSSHFLEKISRAFPSKEGKHLLCVGGSKRQSNRDLNHTTW